MDTTHPHPTVTGPVSTSSSSDATPPNHLGTAVPTGGLGAASHDPEKIGHHSAAHDAATTPAESKRDLGAPDDEEEDEDIDALIDELESQNGDVEEEEETTEVGAARPVPEELLNTDTRRGLSDHDVVTRRKKYGLNQMKEEKENLILKFLMYFVGPIQFVMEVWPFFFNTFVSIRLWHCPTPYSFCFVVVVILDVPVAAPFPALACDEPPLFPLTPTSTSQESRLHPTPPKSAR